MTEAVTFRLAEVKTLCVRYRVLRLDIFGSGGGSGYVAGKSDLDFLVEFEAVSPGDHANAYFGLLAALQDLFRCDIDLVEIKAVRNPYLLRSINRQRVPLYAA